MRKHIGIVAVSPEGSALCYRKIGRRASQITDPARRPAITLHNLPFASYLEAIRRDDWQTVGTMLRWSAETLSAAGVDFCILPDNAAHHAIHFAESGSPLPWIHMTELVADAVQRDGRKTMGIIGTKLVMNGSAYQSVLGMKGVILLTPDESDADAINRIIFGELVEGRVEASSRRSLVDAICRLADRGCEGVILGSTETPLIVGRDQSPIPTYDPVELLVDEAMRRAMAD
ncbi:MAG: amino acid racemase [Planctomycetota bacterium]|nr:amino acid racemase [Planctomycetota bacterium]